MIHFACVYCGRKIRAKDGLAHSQIKCPACGHTIRVKPATESGPASTEKRDSADAAPGETLRWQGKSDREIADELFKRQPLTEEQERRQVARQALSPWMPHYDSLTLFALSSTFIILLLLKPDVKPPPMSHIVAKPLGNVVLALARHLSVLIPLAGVGMVLSLVGVFYQKPKPMEVKWLMLCFAVMVTAGTGIYAGYVALMTVSQRWLIVFPAWNILSAAIPLLLFRAGLLDTDVILDTQTRFWQVIVTLTVTIVLLVVCLYIFKMHWAVTYSICVSYTMSLNHAIMKVFGGGEAEVEMKGE
jgi:DNA-directed RNA polymerase subunit RPC12/RpoP